MVGDYRERLDALRRSHSGTSTGWLLGSREAPVVRVERVLAASIDDVWSACTESDRLARWLATVDAPSLVVGEAVTVRLGAANGPGEGSPASWQVRRLDAPTLIELGWDDESDHGGTLTIQLEDVSPDASHTRLVLVHVLAEAPGAIDQAADINLYDELLPGYTEQARRLAGLGELDSTA